MKKLTTCVALLLAATMGMNAQKPMNAPKGGKAISDELLGIFFEDISSSADGGLYAELIQNGSFEYSPAERDGWGAGTSWKVTRPGHSLGLLEVRKDNGIHPNNPTYMRLTAERVREFYDYKGWRGYGIENSGFGGISVKSGAMYDFSVFLRNYGQAKQLRVVLVEPQRGKEPKLLAEAFVTADAADWKKYNAVLVPNADSKKAVLQILMLTQGVMDVDMVSLMLLICLICFKEMKI